MSDLTAAAMRLVFAYDRNVDALNGKGHDGEPHDRALHMGTLGDVEIFDTVADCSACGGAQYGTDDAIQQAVVDVKVALGLTLRPYEEWRVGESGEPKETSEALTGSGLDVERLRQALHAADPNRYAECYHGLTVSDCGIDAQDIAHEYAALSGESGETHYPGQHDDCIATVPHWHARPYRAGEWGVGESGEPTCAHGVPVGLACRRCVGESGEPHTHTSWDAASVLRGNSVPLGESGEPKEPRA